MNFLDFLTNSTSIGGISPRSRSSDPSNSITTFLSSLIINISISLCLFILFCLLRPRLRRVYAPRTYAIHTNKRSQPISNGLLSWVPAILKVPDTEIIERTGLDTYMLLRSIRLMFIIFTVISLVTLGALLPINLVGTMQATGLARMSMGNVDPQSHLLWVHLGVFVGLIVWVLWCMVGELRIYSELRIWWLTNPTFRHTNTVLVTGISKDLNETKLKNIFDQLPGGVRQVVINKETKQLEKLVKKRDKLVNKLEHILTQYALACTKHQVLVKRPTQWTLEGQKDSIRHYLNQIVSYNRQLQHPPHLPLQTSALIQFNRQIAGHLSAQSVIDTHLISIRPDVYPEDLIWNSLNHSLWSLRLRKYLSFAITLALTGIWTAMTALLTSLVQVKSLGQLQQFQWLNKHPIALGTFSGTVPTALLAVLMSLLPKLLKWLLKMEGTQRRSDIDLKLLHRYYFFLVWNVYLVTVFSTSLISILTSTVDNPRSIIDLIQTHVPLSATSILTYVLLLAFIGAAKEILQGIPLLLRYLLPLLFARTPQEIYDAEQPIQFKWGEVIPTHSLIFLMGISYSFIIPLVNLFVAVYFGLFYLIYRYQFLYVYCDKNWLTGGLSFPKSIKQWMVGIYISQVYMLLMMVSKLQPHPEPILRVVVSAILLVATVLVHLYVDERYMPVIRYLSLRMANDIEKKSREDLIGLPRGRNWLYLMYGSLVPHWMLDAVVRMFPGLLYSKQTYVEDAIEDTIVDFRNPVLDSPHRCCLWVPLGESSLFANLRHELTQDSSIALRTEDTEIIHNKLKVHF